MAFRIGCIVVVSVLCVGCSDSSVYSPTATPASYKSEGVSAVEFSVPDMMCAEGCGETVKGILAKQPGVKEVVVDFEDRTARVTVEEGQFDSKKALDDLVDKQFLNSSVKGGFGREGTPQ